MNTFDIFIGLTLVNNNCLCVPSPQSNRNTSPKALSAIEGWLRSFEWTADEVPKNVTSIIYHFNINIELIIYS